MNAIANVNFFATVKLLGVWPNIEANVALHRDVNLIISLLQHVNIRPWVAFFNELQPGQATSLTLA